MNYNLKIENRKALYHNTKIWRKKKGKRERKAVYARLEEAK